jgi:hypothetical protein
MTISAASVRFDDVMILVKLIDVADSTDQGRASHWRGLERSDARKHCRDHPFDRSERMISLNQASIRVSA